MCLSLALSRIMSSISHMNTEELCAFLERSLPDEAGPEIAAVCALWHREGIHGASFPFDMTDDEWREMVPRLALRLRIKRLFREVNPATSSAAGASTPLPVLQYSRLPPGSAPAVLAPSYYAPAPNAFAPAPERFATPQATGRGWAPSQAATTPVQGKKYPQYGAAKKDSAVRVPLPVPPVPFAFSQKTVLSLVPALLKKRKLAAFISRQKVSTVVDWVRRLLAGWTLSPISLATPNEDLARDLVDHMLTPGQKGQTRKPCNKCSTFYPLGLFFPDMGPLTELVFTSPPQPAEMMVSCFCVLCETDRLRKLGVKLPDCPPGLVRLPENDAGGAAAHSPAAAAARMPEVAPPPASRGVYNWPSVPGKRRGDKLKREGQQESARSSNAADEFRLEGADAFNLQQEPLAARKSQRVIKGTKRGGSPLPSDDEEDEEPVPKRKIVRRRKRGLRFTIVKK